MSVNNQWCGTTYSFLNSFILRQADKILAKALGKNAQYPFDWQLAQGQEMRQKSKDGKVTNIRSSYKSVVPVAAQWSVSWSHLPYYISLSGLTSLFTCGGYNDVDGYLVEAEVIDLSSDGSPPPENCRQVPDMLSAKYDHFAMWDRGDNSVLCCGGFGSSQGQRCYKYSGDEWSDMGDVLLQYRALSAAVQLSNGDYWISGGFRWDQSHIRSAA